MKNLLTIFILCIALNANAQKMTIDPVLHNKAWEVSYLPDSSLCLYQPSMKEMINKRKKELDEEIAQYKKDGRETKGLEQSKKEIYYVQPWRVYFIVNGYISADYKDFITPLGKSTKELFVMSLSCGVYGPHSEMSKYSLNAAKDSITIISKQYRLDTTSRNTERYRTLQECWFISTRQYKIKVVNKRKTIFIYNPKSLKIDFDKEKCENAIIERSKIIKEKELEGTWYFIQPNDKTETYKMDYGNASKIDFLPNKTLTFKTYSRYAHQPHYSNWYIKDNQLVWEMTQTADDWGLQTQKFEILDYNNSGVLLLKKIAYNYYYMNLPDTFKMCKNKEYLYALEGEEYNRQRQLNIKPEVIGWEDPYPHINMNWNDGAVTTLTPNSNYKWFVTVPTPAIVELPYKNNYKLRLDAVIKNPKYKKGKTCYYINKTEKYKEYKIDKNAKYYTLRGKEDIKENSLKTFFKALNVEDEVLYFNFNIMGNTIQGIYEIRK